MDIMKRQVFVTFKTKPSFYGVYNIPSQVIYSHSLVPEVMNGTAIWVENLVNDPDLASIQFRD